MGSLNIPMSSITVECNSLSIWWFVVSTPIDWLSLNFVCSIQMWVLLESIILLIILYNYLFATFWKKCQVLVIFLIFSFVQMFKGLPVLQDSLTKMHSTRIRWLKTIAAQNDHCCGEQIFPVAVVVLRLQFVIRWRSRHSIGNSRQALLRFHSLLLKCLTFHVHTFKWVNDAEKERCGEKGARIILKLLCIWNSIS